MADDDEIEWAKEIWAAERDVDDGTGYHVFAVEATVGRWEGDRDTLFHRYVDGDVFDSQQRYFEHMLEAERAKALPIPSAKALQQLKYDVEAMEACSGGAEERALTAYLSILLERIERVKSESNAEGDKNV